MVRIMKENTPIVRFKKNKSAMGALVVLIFIFVICIGSVYWAVELYQVQDLSMSNHPPQLAIGHPDKEFAPFGFDAIGRNLVWRCSFGGLVSLGIGLVAAIISVVTGTLWGAIAGWYGGRIDNVMMRIVDVLYGLPYVLMLILLKFAFESKLIKLFGGNDEIANVVMLFMAIGGVSWMTMARVIRGQVLSLKERPFIEAANALGLSTPRIFFRHLLPNLVGPIIVYATLTVPQAILQESFLSFLGIGIKAPVPSWGSLCAEGVKAFNHIDVHWWMVLFPCLCLGVTLLCLNFIGDGLRDAFEPTS